MAAVDPERFNDPVALKASWAPAEAGGASFRTHRLVRVDSGRLEFRASGAFLGFCAALFGFGLLAVGMGVVFIIDGNWEGAFAFAPAAVFLGAATFFLVISGPRRVFDRRSGRYWSGREPASTAPDSRSTCRLDSIHAIQVLCEEVESESTSDSGSTRISRYRSYELNLVLRDGRRLNVVDHGDIAALREDAASVANLLGCAVWDAAEFVATGKADTGMAALGPQAIAARQRRTKRFAFAASALALLPTAIWCWNLAQPLWRNWHKPAAAPAAATVRANPAPPVAATAAPKARASPDWKSYCAQQPPDRRPLCEARAIASANCMNPSTNEMDEACFVRTAQEELERRQR